MERLVLLYHHVAPGPDNKWQVSPGEFQRQIACLLERGFKVLTLRHYFTDKGPGRKAFITFDDGYADTYEYAFPILRAFGVSASVFLITDYIGQTNEWDHETVSRARHLDASQISELCRNKWEMHSHTASHADFRRLAGDQIERDVQRATEVIGCWNEGPLFCAFPYGRSEPRLIDALFRNRYAGAFVAQPSWPEGDPFRLPRIPVTAQCLQRLNLERVFGC